MVTVPEYSAGIGGGPSATTIPITSPSSRKKMIGLLFIALLVVRRPGSGTDRGQGSGCVHEQPVSLERIHGVCVAVAARSSLDDGCLVVL